MVQITVLQPEYNEDGLVIGQKEVTVQATLVDTEHDGECCCECADS